jgi:branched-chain amino acid aminotransferase
MNEFMSEKIKNPITIEKASISKLDSLDFDNIPFGKKFSDHMFIMDYKDNHWTNPKIVPFEGFSMHPASSVLHYGQSIFEGMKAYKNEKGEVFLFRPEQNIKRLNISAERMCMPSIDVDFVLKALKTLVKLDQDWIPTKRGTSLYVRPFMFATDEFIGVRPSDSYRFCIMTSPVQTYYKGAVKVKIEEHFTRAASGGTGYAKAAGNYAASLYPAKLAKAEGYDQLVWTDAAEHKYIEESGTMNIMFRCGNKILTPSTSDSILSGITRDSVVNLAKDWGYDLEERKISVEEIVNLLRDNKLDEVFGIGTAATIAPIELIGFRDEKFNLSDSKTWEFATKVSNALESLRRGEQEDKFNWIHKLN